MSKHDKLRDDTECQNCGHTVTQAYCGHCGQKNTETRQSFAHLVTHFAEDLTHYDSGFWRTIKYLLFRPAKLTQDYLMGKRQMYVPPVKLYIFISFIAFFLPAILPDFSNDKPTDAHGKSAHEVPTPAAAEDETDIAVAMQKDTVVNFNGHIYHTQQDIDKTYSAGQSNMLEYYVASAQLKVRNDHITQEAILNTFMHTLPKVLFIYMPIFAFWLWLLHGKKRWYFFDHGIFTLHYFSLLLLLSTILYILNWLIALALPNDDVLNNILGLIVTGYSVFYFFRSHSKMYGEKRYISRIKSIFLFIINVFSIAVTLLITVLYVLFHAH
jgi:hypothetical protein